MQPIINPWWIYFASVSEDLSVLFKTIGVVILLAVGMCFIGSFIAEEMNIKPPKWLIAIGLIFSIIGGLLPSEKTVLTMMTVSQITPDNINTIGETGKDIVDYVVEKIDTILDEGDE